MRIIVTAICICSFFATGLSQSTPSNVFSNRDKIKIVKESESVFSYHHAIEKGQNLYALASTFDISVNKLARYNALAVTTPLRIGQIIKVPLDQDKLFKGNSLDGLKSGHYIPIYYKVEPKENLFRISRIYFDQAIEDLMLRNKINTNALSVGQELLIGWFPIDNTTTNLPEVKKEEEFVEDFDYVLPEEPVLGNKDFIYELSPNNKSKKKAYGDSISMVEQIPANIDTTLLGAIPYSENIEPVRKSEVANWDNTIPDNGKVYVLHKNAIIDSYIEMFNPLVKRTVRAKVIGRIPYGAYTQNVSLVLSPQAAKQLGGLDKRFKVEVSALVYKDI